MRPIWTGVTISSALVGAAVGLVGGAIDAPATVSEVAERWPAGSDGDEFVEDFTGDTGLERFDTGVYHRDDVLVANETWTGDHDQACGPPDTQRTIHRDRPDESFYLCRDHLMTSVGDTSGYSIAWFSPKQVFQRGAHRSISWDANVTDLGGRQWWEVVLVPEGAPFLATVDWIAGTAGIDSYHPETIEVGIGPFGRSGTIFSGGESRAPLGWMHVPDADPEGAASKAIRRPFRMVDNLDGTITFTYLGETYTYPGRFPDRFRVYFKDHNYTPDKDGVPAGHTWHWDTIVVR